LGLNIRVVIDCNGETSHDKLNFISRSNGPYYLFCIINVVFMIIDLIEIIIDLGFKHVKIVKF